MVVGRSKDAAAAPLTNFRRVNFIRFVHRLQSAVVSCNCLECEVDTEPRLSAGILQIMSHTRLVNFLKGTLRLLKLYRSVSLTVFVVVLSGFLPSRLVAQVTPPPAQQPTTSVPSQEPKRDAAPSLGSSRNFVSLEGRFSISLPEQSHGFQALSFKTPFGVARGDATSWRLKEASFVVGYADAAQPVDTPEAAKQVFDALREAAKKLASENSGVVAADKPIELNKHQGLEQRVDLFTGFMAQRTYLVSRRLYQTVLVVRTEQREYEAVARKMFDSFKIMSECGCYRKGLLKRRLKAEPSPLPQQPVAQRVGTDATDVMVYHGKVKTVLEESQDLTGTWSVQTRKRDAFENYNELGNLTRRESYDYKGNLTRLLSTAISTAIVSLTSKRLGANITLHLMAPLRPVPQRSLMPRYQYKLISSMTNRNVYLKSICFTTTVNVTMRYVYKYTGNQLESLVYSADGSLNQRSVSLLDSKGNRD